MQERRCSDRIRCLPDRMIAEYGNFAICSLLEKLYRPVEIQEGMKAYQRTIRWNGVLHFEASNFFAKTIRFYL